MLASPQEFPSHSSLSQLHPVLTVRIMISFPPDVADVEDEADDAITLLPPPLLSPTPLPPPLPPLPPPPPVAVVEEEEVKAEEE